MELLDEWGVARYAQRRIYESIRAHWLDRVAPDYRKVRQ